MCSGNLYAYNPFEDEEKKLWTVYEFNLKKSLLIYIYIYIEMPRRRKESV